MVNALSNSLLITVIGMGLVFAVLILLWGLMLLVMRMISHDTEKNAPVEEIPDLPTPATSDEPPVKDLQRQRAAAAAVAVAIALIPPSTAAPAAPPPPVRLSAWQAVGRSNQIYSRMKRS